MAASPRRLQINQRFFHALIGLSGLVLLLSTGLSIHTAVNLRHTIGSVTHSYDVTQYLAMLGRALGDAEAAQRANLLIEDEVSRERLRLASAEARQHLASLKALLADNPEQTERLATVKSLIEARLAALLSIADAKPGDVLEALRRPVDQGGATMGSGQLRRIVDDMTAAEARLLRERSAEMESLIAQTNSTVIIANALAILAAGLGLLLIGRSRRAWQRALDAESDKRQAQRASAEKSQFLANMSHEIRTPMNAIFGFAQLLSQRELDPQSRQYLRAIETSGDSLLSLINDILDLSKIEAGRLELQQRPTDLRELIDGSLSVFAQLAAEKQLRMSADIDPALPLALLTDPDRIRQILFNLIGNALKFTEHGGVTVRVRLIRPAANARVAIQLSVEDTGVGIEATQLQRIFEPFHQAPGGDGQPRPGSGLGLSICRQLVGLLGGTLEVSSRIGEGSIFRCDFPAMALSDAPVEASQARWESAVDFNRLRPLKLLVVDDVAWNRELILAIFAGSHHVLRSAADGLEAIERVSEDRPDVILMDLRMPRLDGRSACQRLRERWGAQSPRIVALTASSMSGEDTDWRDHFDAYLRKPLARSDLFRTLAELVGTDSTPASSTPAAQPESGSRHPSPAADQSPTIDERSLEAARARLQSLLDERLPALQRSLRMREVGRFAQALQEIGEQARWPVIARYGDRLAEAVQQFDITTAESLLQQFPAHAGAVLAQVDSEEPGKPS